MFLKEKKSDQAILDQLKSGDPQALTLLFNEYYQQLCRFAFCFIPENEVIEELTANVFINLWENRTRIQIHTGIRPYLYQAAKNQVISYLRKKKPLTHPLEEGLDFSDKKDRTPEAIYIENELNIEFIQAFKKLPPRAKLAFKLHRFDGLTYSEVADIMKISVAAVEKNITSALKILHRELAEITQVR